MKLTIIGSGYVGLTTGTCFAEMGHEVVCVDHDKAKVEELLSGRIPIYEPKLEVLIRQNVAARRLSFSTSTEEGVRHGDVIFIAVPTPPQTDGSVDLSFVECVASEIAACMHKDQGYKVIVDKSTVPVKTGDRVADIIRSHAPEGIEFDVVSNPEFLREGCAVDDLLNPDRIVVGADSMKAANVMKEIYDRFNAPFILTDVNSAELIKHAANSFLALKISYINAISAICEATGADVNDVARGLGMDKRIGRSFFNAGLGYGGSCFPKDVKAFIAISEQLGVPFNLLKEVEQINEDQRKRFLDRIVKRVGSLKGKTIALWGLAFKQNTDDIRESIAIKLCREMLAMGAKVQAYDPKAIATTKKLANLTGDISYAEDMFQALEGADFLVVGTEWPEFVEVELSRIKSALKTPLVFDGRNIFRRRNMTVEGIEYVCIGRPSLA